MVRKKVIEVILGMAVIAGQSSASEEVYQMDNRNFWVDLGYLVSDIEKLDRSEFRFGSPNRESLVKRINEIMEEYIRREDNDEEKSYGDLYFLYGLMKMLRQYPEELSQTIKDRVSDIIEYLRIDDGETFDTPEEVIFYYMYVNSPESLGQYHL